MAEKLHPKSRQEVISFIDYYGKNQEFLSKEEFFELISPLEFEPEEEIDDEKEDEEDGEILGRIEDKVANYLDWRMEFFCDEGILEKLNKLKLLALSPFKFFKHFLTTEEKILRLSFEVIRTRLEEEKVQLSDLEISNFIMAVNPKEKDSITYDNLKCFFSLFEAQNGAKSSRKSYCRTDRIRGYSGRKSNITLTNNTIVSKQGNLSMRTVSTKVPKLELNISENILNKCIFPEPDEDSMKVSKIELDAYSISKKMNQMENSEQPLIIESEVLHQRKIIDQERSTFKEKAKCLVSGIEELQNKVRIFKGSISRSKARQSFVDLSRTEGEIKKMNNNISGLREFEEKKKIENEEVEIRKNLFKDYSENFNYGNYGENPYLKQKFEKGEEGSGEKASYDRFRLNHEDSDYCIQNSVVKTDRSSKRGYSKNRNVLKEKRVPLACISQKKGREEEISDSCVNKALKIVLNSKNWFKSNTEKNKQKTEEIEQKKIEPETPKEYYKTPKLIFHHEFEDDFIPNEDKIFYKIYDSEATSEASKNYDTDIKTPSTMTQPGDRSTEKKYLSKNARFFVKHLRKMLEKESNLEQVKQILFSSDKKFTIWRLYRMIDTEDKGFFTFEQFTTFLKKLGIFMSVKDQDSVIDLFSTYDTKQSYKMDYRQFRNMLAFIDYNSHENKLGREANLPVENHETLENLVIVFKALIESKRCIETAKQEMANIGVDLSELFDEIDHFQKGFLVKEDFSKLLKNENPGFIELSYEDVDLFVKRCDLDRDGKINFRDFYLHFSR